MSAAPQDGAAPAHQAELRVLSGRHAGASVPLDGASLRVGPHDDCDVILSDMVLAHDRPAWLQAEGGRWRITATAPQDGATNDPVMAEDDLLLAPLAFGQVGVLGDVALTVSAPHAPWQQRAGSGASAARGPARANAARHSPQPAKAPPAPEPSAQQPPVASAQQQQPAAALAAAAAGGAATGSGAPAPRARRRRALAAGAAVLVLAGGVLAALWALGQAPATPPAPAAAAPAPDPARQQQLLQDVRLALASVDPALRLPIEPLPDGRVRVSGWVASVEQLDRVTEALASVRPPPLLALRTTAELLDDLRAAAGAIGGTLTFSLEGAGRVRAQGSVPSAGEHDRLLDALRERLPPGVELVDGVRSAETQAPVVQQWLQDAGLDGAQARWDAEAGQLRVRVDVTPQQRTLLERLLTQPGQPLAGVPFTLDARELAAAPAAAPVHASAAPLPFRIRSVVGGASPYVVLEGGAKLQPGGRRGAWRLERITADALVFDGPRRLVLAR